MEETMKKAFSSLTAAITISLVMIALVCQTSLALTKEVPMRGAGAGQVTSLTPGPTGVTITAVGSGEATHLGRFTRTEEILLDPATGVLTGSITFIAADGSELYCDLNGAFTGQATASGTYTFTGGTGRFENSSGEAEFSIVQSDPANFTFEFAGVIELF